MNPGLDGKVAVVTGAASGIGLATVERFVEAGVRVIAADLREDAGQALAARFPGVVRFARCDVTRLDELRAAVDAAGEHFFAFLPTQAAGDYKTVIQTDIKGEKVNARFSFSK